MLIYHVSVRHGNNYTASIQWFIIQSCWEWEKEALKKRLSFKFDFPVVRNIERNSKIAKIDPVDKTLW